MKFSTSAAFSAAAIAVVSASAINTPTYQLMVTNSKNSEINGTFVTRKDMKTGDVPNELGVWLEDGIKRTPIQITPRSTTETTTEKRVFELWTVGSDASTASKLLLKGDPIAMEFFDDKSPENLTPYNKNETMFWNRFLLLQLNNNAVIRQAQDFAQSTPTGGAGSWRICRGFDSQSKDYQLFWYDGSSDLASVVKNCEGVSLIAYPVANGQTPTSTAAIPVGTGSSSINISGSNSTTTPSLPASTIPGAASKAFQYTSLGYLIIGALILIF